MNIKKTTYSDLTTLIPLFIKKHNNNQLLSSDFNQEEILNHANYILENGYAYTVTNDNKAVAYLLSYKVNELFFKEKGVYTPEFGFFSTDNNLLHQNMLIKTLLQDMKKDGYTHHAITLIKENMDESFIDLGYGKRVVDVSRFIPKHTNVNDNIIMEKASKDDIDELYPIYKEHLDYMSSSPIFLDVKDPGYELTESIEDGNLYLFKHNNKFIAFTTLDYKEPAGSRFFKDEKTVSIKGTHVKKEYQNKGYGKEILKLIDNYCLNEGFIKQCSDFESLNYKANLFWPKHFTIVANSYVRYIGK